MYINTETNEYPVTKWGIIAEYKNTSFPVPFVPPEKYELVSPTQKPATNIYQKAVEGQPELIGGQYYQTWQIVDRYTPAEEAAALQTYIEDRCDEVEAMNDDKLYTNVTATFPAGDKVIQFRNERDRTNLANVATAAMALVMQGTPEATIEYRTEDNVTQTLRADQMMGIAMGVLSEKQAVKEVAWAHKDALRAMTDYTTAKNYDITTGWPA